MPNVVVSSDDCVSVLVGPNKRRRTGLLVVLLDEMLVQCSI